MGDKITRESLKKMTFQEVMAIWREMHDAPRTVAEHVEMTYTREYALLVERLKEFPESYPKMKEKTENKNI